MSAFLEEFLGVSLIDTMGVYLGTLVTSFFAFLALDFLIQLLLIFWRWVFRVR